MGLLLLQGKFIFKLIEVAAIGGSLSKGVLGFIASCFASQICKERGAQQMRRCREEESSRLECF